MSRKVMLLAAIVAVVLAAAVPALAKVQKKDVPGIFISSRVDATVGCGGIFTPSAMLALKAEGNYGKGRYVLRVTAPKVRAEL